MDNENKTLRELEEEAWNKNEDVNIIDALKPRPIFEVEMKLAGLRLSDKFTDIKKSSRAPKGWYCEFCENLATKYEPRICSWNDEVTGMVDYAYCEFFNVRLDQEHGECCNNRCKKCLACLMQTRES